MNTEELENCLREYNFVSNNCLGVFSSDQIPKIEKIPACFISNTDPSTKPGQHWIAIFVNKNGVAEIFDSYGLKPKGIFIEYLKKFKKWTYNNQRLQGAASTTCGQYCLCYLFFKCLGLDKKSVLEAFDKNYFHFNDHLVNDICSQYFNLNHNVFSNNKLNQFCVALGH